MCQFLLSAEHCSNSPVPQTDQINTIKINLKRWYRSAVSSYRISNIPIGDGSVDTHTSATDCLHSTQLNSTVLCCAVRCFVTLSCIILWYTTMHIAIICLPFPSLLFPSLPFSSLPFLSFSFLCYDPCNVPTVPCTSAEGIKSFKSWGIVFCWAW